MSYYLIFSPSSYDNFPTAPEDYRLALYCFASPSFHSTQSSNGLAASVHEFPYFHVVEISYSLHKIALFLSPPFDNAGQWQNNTYSSGIPLFLLLPQYKTAAGLPVEFVFHRSTADYVVSLNCLFCLQQTSLFPLSWKASIFSFNIVALLSN